MATIDELKSAQISQNALRIHLKALSLGLVIRPLYEDCVPQSPGIENEKLNFALQRNLSNNLTDAVIGGNMTDILLVVLINSKFDPFALQRGTPSRFLEKKNMNKPQDLGFHMI